MEAFAERTAERKGIVIPLGAAWIARRFLEGGYMKNYERYPVGINR